SKRNTMGVQYRYTNNSNTNNGSVFSLPETGSTLTSKDNTLRFSFTTIASEHMVNEARFQINRRSSVSQALNSGPAIVVTEAFTAGRNQGELFANTTTEGLEMTDDVTYRRRMHTI